MRERTRFEREVGGLLGGTAVHTEWETAQEAAKCQQAWDKFLATFDSFAIKGQVNQAKELAKKYEITGVPSMVVNGKYRFDLGTAQGPEGVLNVADQLIAKERAAK